MAGKNKNQVTISREAVRQRFAEMDAKKRAKQARKRHFEQALLLLLICFLGLFAIGIKRRAPWYVNQVEPVVQKVMAHLTPPTVEQKADAERKALAKTLPTYGEVDENAWQGQWQNPQNTGTETTPRTTEPTAIDRPPARVNTATRPRPADLNFHRLKTEVRRHVFNQPKGARKLEAERVTYIASARDHLILLMRFIPYETGPGGLFLHRGRTGPGTVVGANDRGFLFRSENGGGHRTIPWEDIALEQYVLFFQYYIAWRVDFDGIPSLSALSNAGRRTTIQGRRDAAGECLLVGLLCDWYGQPEIGQKFLKLAVTYDAQSPARRFLARQFQISSRK